MDDSHSVYTHYIYSQHGAYTPEDKTLEELKLYTVLDAMDDVIDGIVSYSNEEAEEGAKKRPER